MTRKQKARTLPYKPERCPYCEFTNPDAEKIASLGDVNLLVCPDHVKRWQKDLRLQGAGLAEEMNEHVSVAMFKMMNPRGVVTPDLRKKYPGLVT